MRCQYRKCKAMSEYKTPFGEMCPYHFKVLEKKKNLKGEKIERTKLEKQLYKRFKLMKTVTIKFKGGKK